MTRKPRRGPTAPNPARLEEITPTPFSDDAIADAFAAKHEGYLKYDPSLRGWRRWSGRCWQRDAGQAVFNDIRLHCRTAAAATESQALALRLASARKVAAVEHMARSDPRLLAAAGLWDGEDFLLNTEEGILDLRAGKMGLHDPAFYCTRMVAVAPRGTSTRWLTFLAEVTDGDQDLEAFLQRVAGYCLTGSVKEQALFFLLGSGANGKSLFARILAAVLGPYSTTAAMDTFLASSLSRHPTELAALQGARLVLASEANRSARWDEARLKVLTGGEDVAARFMRHDFAVHRPTYKLLITGNHPPRLSGAGEALRRRFHIIPFAVTITPDRRDPNLFVKLSEEIPGILQWAVEGCLAWQQEGLAPPSRVVAFTSEYFRREDTLGRFLDECCDLGSVRSVGSTDLHRAYGRWATACGEPQRSQRDLVQELASRGFTASRTAAIRIIRGLGLKESGTGGGGTP